MQKKLDIKKLLIVGVILTAALIGGWRWWSKSQADGLIKRPNGMIGGQGMRPGQELTEAEREERQEEMKEMMKKDGLTDEEIELRLEQRSESFQDGSGPVRMPIKN